MRSSIFNREMRTRYQIAHALTGIPKLRRILVSERLLPNLVQFNLLIVFQHQTFPTSRKMIFGLVAQLHKVVLEFDVVLFGLCAVFVSSRIILLEVMKADDLRIAVLRNPMAGKFLAYRDFGLGNPMTGKFLAYRDFGPGEART